MSEDKFSPKFTQNLHKYTAYGQHLELDRTNKSKFSQLTHPNTGRNVFHSVIVPYICGEERHVEYVGLTDQWRFGVGWTGSRVDTDSLFYPHYIMAILCSAGRAWFCGCASLPAKRLARVGKSFDALLRVRSEWRKSRAFELRASRAWQLVS